MAGARKMNLQNRRGLTLIETLVGVLLLSICLANILGTFLISNMSTARAKHRFAAMNIVKQYLEQEIKAGHDGGNGDEAAYHATITSGAAIAVTIDDRGTLDSSDDLLGTITPDPYYPDNVENPDGSPISYQGLPYKIIGFVASWNEDIIGQSCSERAVAYVSYHPSA